MTAAGPGVRSMADNKYKFVEGIYINNDALHSVNLHTCLL